jgi:hypothetical protein
VFRFDSAFLRRSRDARRENTEARTRLVKRTL